MTYLESIHNVKKKMSTTSVPIRPTEFGKEYTFPEDLTNISSEELGRWLSKLTAWESYSMRLYARSEIEFNILEDYFNAELSKHTWKTSDSKRPSKELSLGGFIQKPENSDLFTQLSEKRTEVAAYKRLTELYTIQLNAVSREITRRAMDIKALHKGLEGA